jgi:hypothetical protein
VAASAAATKDPFTARDLLPELARQYKQRRADLHIDQAEPGRKRAQDCYVIVTALTTNIGYLVS